MVNYTQFAANGGLFACANSGFGFVSHFNELFDGYSTLYLIKGGSGTGKSGLIKKVWKEATQKAIPTLPILCSSDPSSLDGLLLPTLKTVLADATAPHLLEPVLPGAREQLIDTGRFWNASALRARKEELTTLSHRKKELYAQAYLLFEGGKNAALCASNRTKHRLLAEKADRALSGWIKKSGATKGAITRLFDRALSMQGALCSDALFRKAEKIYTLPATPSGEGQVLLERLWQRLKKEGFSLLLIKDPLTLLPCALYFEERGVLFRYGAPQKSNNEQIIDPRRFFSPDAKEERKRARALTNASALLINEGLSLLSEIKPLHFQAEAIYGQAMDFSALEDYENAFVSHLFKEASLQGTHPAP